MTVETRQYTWEEIKASVPKKYTSEEVRSSKGALIVIRNKVYDLSGDFSSWHPGGSVALTQIGMDATGPFEGFHDPKTFLTLKKYYVGDLAPDQIHPPTEFENDVQQIRQNILKMKLYDSDKLYYLRILSIIFALIGTSYGILYLLPNNILAIVVSSALLGLAFQQSGWLAHDCCHHQVFKNRDLGNMAGWKQKHCTHHAAPNVHAHDPDINTMPFLAWSEYAIEGFADLSDKDVAKFMVKYQPILIFPLLSIARLSWALHSILWNATSKRILEFPSLPTVERVLIGIHYVWYLGGAFLLLSPVNAIVWAVLVQVFCGIFLSTVFSLNHNGRPVYSIEQASTKNFYELAIVTGRNVTPGVFNDWFTGGLNYQMEHHMFPTVPRHNLPKTSKMVQELCKKHNVPYHTTGYIDGLKEIVDRLSVIAKSAEKQGLLQ
ncbi:hypothetical protein HK103_007619 [Boothiomyces macroporosus]|uniref:Cytochrome b5 heme-binding domain-containing protein n=1 Tax=Boothiomyces macroporosus TaxID=261099 RepID=A0AAD5UFN7_9FUNG|nr:hypothetical protein HK103_007619 [Boothiomyces macroporosus]